MRVSTYDKHMHKTTTQPIARVINTLRKAVLTNTLRIVKAHNIKE